MEDTSTRRTAIRKLNKQLRRDFDFFSGRFSAKARKFGVIRYGNPTEFYFYELDADSSCRRVDPIRVAAYTTQG